MSKDSFLWLLNTIKDDPVFHSQSPLVYNPLREQRPVVIQLMIFLCYLGTKGSGACNADVCNNWFIGAGSGEEYRKHVCIAICRNLQSKAITWPDATEHKQILDQVAAKHVFPNCVGFANGTLMPLAMQPTSVDAPDYFCCKHFYAMNTLIVCDDRKRIHYYYAGCPGSVHDNCVFKNCSLAKRPNEFFDDNQYIMTDTGYDCYSYCVSYYRKPPNNPMPPDYAAFNSACCKARICVEHTIGMLKGWWQWLQEIRKKVTDKPASVQSIVEYIKCVIILHNMLLTTCNDDIPNSWIEQDDDDLELTGYGLDLCIPANAPNQERQSRLTTYVLSCQTLMELQG
jgi:DDE superfamily endonuclease